VLSEKYLTMAVCPGVPTSTTFRASSSASIIGSAWSFERIFDTVDFPVEMEPVRPIRSILVCLFVGCGKEGGIKGIKG